MGLGECWSRRAGTVACAQERRRALMATAKKRPEVATNTICGMAIALVVANASAGQGCRRGETAMVHERCRNRSSQLRYRSLLAFTRLAANRRALRAPNGLPPPKGSPLSNGLPYRVQFHTCPVQHAHRHRLAPTYTPSAHTPRALQRAHSAAPSPSVACPLVLARIPA